MPKGIKRDKKEEKKQKINKEKFIYLL